METNWKSIFVVASLYSLGSYYFISWNQPVSQSRSLASTPTCRDLLKQIAHESQDDVKVSDVKLQTLYNQFGITDHVLKDLVESHKLNARELTALEALRTKTNEALEQAVGRNVHLPSLTPLEQDQYHKKLTSIMTESLTYIHTCRSYKRVKQNACLSFINEAIFSNKRNEYTKRFKRISNKVKKYRRRLELDGETAVDINAKALSYQTVRLACSSKKMNTRKTMSTLYFIGGVVTADFATNIALNFMESDNADWEEIVQQDLLYNVAFTFIQSSIASMRAGLAVKTGAEWLIRALRDYPAMLTYSKYAAPSEEELLERAKQLMSNPEFKAQLTSLLNIIEKEEIIQLVQQELEKYEESENISEKFSEESQDNLMQIVAYEAYLREADGLIKTGDLATDYYALNRAWDAYATFQTMTLSVLLLKYTCVNPILNIHANMALAGTFLAINKFFLDQTFKVIKGEGLDI